MQIEKKQPLSPHLQIYKPQISSVTSILHRITGVFLFLGTLFLIWTIFFFVYEYKQLDFLYALLVNNMAGKFLIYLFVFSMFYHSLNGIRYLFWSFAKGMEVKTICYTGWAIIITSFLLTLLIAVLV